MLSREATITVLPFSQQREGEDIIIGRVETGVFLAVPPEAVEILEDLARGETVGAVTDSYQVKHGEIPDLEDLLKYLQSKGIVNISSGLGSIPEREARVSAVPSPKVRYHFSNFPASVAQRVFGRPALMGCLAIILVTSALCIEHPALLPRARDLYFPDHRTVSWIVLLMASYTTLFVHEFAHLVAARALGVNSRLAISHRLWYLVAETDLTGLWSVPKEKRYLPMLAGVIVDATSGCLLLLLVNANNFYGMRLPDRAVHLLRAMAFVYLMRLAWQCLLYMRTDFYYVIAAFFNCKSLMRDTETFLRNRMSGLFSRIRKVDQSSIPAKERRVISIYAVLWIGGRIVALSLLWAVTIPVAILYIKNLASVFRTGYAVDRANFVDSVLVAAYFLVPTVAGFALWFRSLLRAERT